jgi:mannosyl-3-phosphoglycerate phosphatase family protein
MVELSVQTVLGLIGTIILVGLAGEWVFKKTGIPSVLILIGLGMLLGPGLKLIDPLSITKTAPYFGTLALLIILFDGGLNLKIIKVLREAPFALLFTILVFFVTIAAVAVTYRFVFGGSWELGLLMGAIMGGSTGVIVIPVLSQMKFISDDTKVILSLESAFTDVFVVVGALALIGLLTNPTAGLAGLLPLVFHSFLDALLLASIAGILWARFMGMLQGQPLSYMLTLAAILVLYNVAELLGGNGAITILFFGLVLGNMEEIIAKAHRHVRRIIGVNLEVAGFAIDVFLKRLNEEISFLVRTFFYVLLGLIFDLHALTLQVTAGGFLLFLAALGSRSAVAWGLGFFKPVWTVREQRIIVAMLPRGLACAVMAFAPASQGVPGTESFPLLALMVIGLSVLYMTLALYYERWQAPVADKSAEVADATVAPVAPTGRPQMVLFTDLDGTLLDATTYRYDEARPALERLQQAHVPLVICTSKTRAEVEPLRKELDNRDPFIVENGGALYIPPGYFKAPPPGAIERGDYHVIEFGVPYSRLREALRRIEKQVGVSLIGFGDLTIEEIVKATGLAQTDAERARQREYDEPFLIKGEHSPLEQIREAAAQIGITVVSGGQFYHLVGGTDKGRACRVLIDLFRKEWGKVVTAGIGDSLNDLPMLEMVDCPFLVERQEGGYAEGLAREGLTRVSGRGPAGWQRGVTQLLAGLEQNMPPAPPDPAQ